MSIKLGVIGMSEGNGHPFSWSAIFNGYSPDAMSQCGFPAIPEYLAQQRWPQAHIPNAEVSCVWTQSRQTSEKIAEAAYIGHIVSEPGEMLGQVDAVLLARDDAENHYEFASPFLKAGLPVYIDKPVALSVAQMDRLYALEQYPGQIFTCSGLRYAAELQLTDPDREAIGDIKTIDGITPKSWQKYAIHIIEPVLKLLSADDVIVAAERSDLPHSGVKTTVKWDSGVVTTFTATGQSSPPPPMAIRVAGQESDKELVFKDSFACFRAALCDFIYGIEKRSVQSPRAFNEKAIYLLEKGMQA